MIVKIIEKDGRFFLPLDRKQVERLGYDLENGIEMREDGTRIVLEAHRETFRKLAY